MNKIYLIKSDSYQLLNDKINELVGDIQNVSDFSLSEVTINDVIEDAGYFGLFDSKKAVIVHDVKYFGGKFLYEDDTNKLNEFLSNIDDILILFICEEISKDKAITKRMIEIGAEIIDINSKESQSKYIDEYCKKHELVIDNNIIDIIMQNAMNDLDVFLQEINRLSLISKRITKEIVDKYSVKSNIDDVSFDFSNAVIDKNFAKAFDLLDQLLDNGTEPVSIIGLLANSYTNIYMVKDAVNHGLTDDEIAKVLGYSNSKRVFVMKKNGNKYDLDTLKNIILKLSDLDIKIKTGLNPVYEIKEFLLNL